LLVIFFQFLIVAFFPAAVISQMERETLSTVEAMKFERQSR
jgi:hypothetical protein